MASKRPEEVFFEGLAEVTKVPLDEISTEKTAQQALRPVSRSNLFSHPETHPFVLDVALLKAFKLEWFEWEQETLFSEIEQTFNTSVADINKVKILAAMTVHVTDVFWDQWEIFENVILAFNGIVPRPRYMQPPDVAALMAGVDIVNSIRKEEFSDEVGRYAAACFLNDEISYAPPPLDFCQPYLSRYRYKCTHCGNHGDAFPPFDGRCDSCSRKFEDAHPLNFRPDANAKDDPEDVEYYIVLDPVPTKRRYEEMMRTPADQIRIDETADDIEAAKLIAATDYMNFRQQQRDKQLTQIKDWMSDS